MEIGGGSQFFLFMSLSIFLIDMSIRNFGIQLKAFYKWLETILSEELNVIHGQWGVTEGS